jgi:hypothetical protein
MSTLPSSSQLITISAFDLDSGHYVPHTLPQEIENNSLLAGIQ